MKRMSRRPVARSSSITSVPMMSDGIRSGVNWMRLNFRWIAWASVLMSRVLARPGTPRSRQWPPAKKAVRMSCTTACCPMIARPSSSRRPDARRCASSNVIDEIVSAAAYLVRKPNWRSICDANRIVNLMRYDWRTVTAAVAAVGAMFAAGCTKTETSITAPSGAADRCSLTVTTSPNSFPSPGGKGSLTISTARDCTWSVASNASWVALGGGGGQGEGTIPYTVAANPVPSPRSAAIAVGAQSVAVSQQAAPCVFSLSRANDTIGEIGGKLSVGVTTLSGCRWTAASGATWISVTAGQSGDANGTVGLTVAANAGPARVGQVNIAGQTYTVSQAATAASPAPAPSPAPGPPPPGPTPGPPPAPTPTPTPRHVEFSGTISSVFGRCPSVVFTAGGRAIFVDESTDFQKSKCGDLREGRDVDGEGDVQANGTIRATAIRVAKKDDDH